MRWTGERAVVLGARMGGLLGARVSADCYRTVTVVERDVLGLRSRAAAGSAAGRNGIRSQKHIQTDGAFIGSAITSRMSTHLPNCTTNSNAMMERRSL